MLHRAAAGGAGALALPCSAPASGQLLTLLLQPNLRGLPIAVLSAAITASSFTGLPTHGTFIMRQQAHNSATSSSGSSAPTSSTGALPRATGHSGGGSSRGPKGWWRQPLFRTLVAAAGLAGALGAAPGSVLLAEERRGDDSTGSTGGAGGTGRGPEGDSWQGPGHWHSGSFGSFGGPGDEATPRGHSPLDKQLAAAQALMTSMWQELLEDIHRARARSQLPPASAGLGATEPPPPTISLGSSSGSGFGSSFRPDQRELRATLLLPGDCDVDAVVSALVSALSGAGGGGSGRRHTTNRFDLDGSRTFTMELTRGAGPLGVRLSSPPRVAAGGKHDAGLVTLVLSKRLGGGGGGGGGFSPEELRALVAAGRAAYLGERRPPGLGAAVRGEAAEELERGLDHVVNELERYVMREFTGGFHWMAHELERAFQQQQQRQPGDEDEDEDEDEQDDGGGGMFGPFPTPGAGRSFTSSSSSSSSSPRTFAPRAGDEPLAARGGRPGAAPAHDWGSPAAAKAVKQLQAMGAQVYPPASKDKLDWGILAGYEVQKRQIEDCLLYPLLRPEVYNKVAEATRESFQSNRPRAVLFDGPPGTGKTTSARVISCQAAVPLVYVPLEAVLSKWYGESEGLLAKVFSAAEALGGAIIFFDEMDALGGNRERGDVHEASRRMLSVLLREMDGFDARRSVVIGATNRKSDLDAALLSRFDMVVTFGLPDTPCRQQILQRYARHLSQEQLLRLAHVTPGLSGRDLRDVAEHTERQWASRIVRGEQPEGSLPGVEDYVSSAKERVAALEKEGRAGLGHGQHLYSM